MREKRNACRDLWKKYEIKRPLIRYIGIQEDNIKMDLRETGWQCGLNHLIQARDQ
jgi:hypothetical protein